MRLIRFGVPGTEKPGLLLKDDTRVDVSSRLGVDGLGKSRQEIVALRQK